LKVRANVRQLDERSKALEDLGAEIVKGDLTDLADVSRMMTGCRRIYFGMSVSPAYLEATANVAAVAKSMDIDVIVNMSQMTVSEMSLTKTTSSPQHKLHWLSEQILNWSGLPVVHIRPTVFLEHPFFNLWAADSIKHSNKLQFPLGESRTSPIATIDVARVVVTVLSNPKSHVGKVYELTGHSSLNGQELAAQYSAALGRTIEYVDYPIEAWTKEFLPKTGLPTHVAAHIGTMAKMHHANQYARLVKTVEEVTGIPALSVKQWVEANKRTFL